MKKIAIIGSGGLGREILGIIQSINRKKKTWDFIGFYDDNLSDDLVNGYPIIDEIETLNSIKEELHICIGIGNPKVKELLYQKIINPNILYPTIIQPSVQIYSNDTVRLGKGIVIGANCVLTVNITIADFVYLNTSCVISHDTEIGNYTMVMPTVAISSGAKIGKRVYIGNGTKIDYPIVIKDDSIIKSGAVLSNF